MLVDEVGPEGPRGCGYEVVLQKFNLSYCGCLYDFAGQLLEANVRDEV